ncbi:hypothetical protein [Enterobacter sp. FB]|uniref:hypothetical protein n=1 Tax=Enterobacter sp. FB TaxID=1571816 RepID=UPI00068D19CB|nr:hypothetical protein [Enterobacter sp. FB]OIR49556.1 hypothetical protein BH716_13025 [Lelliottia nimipressuralis]
MSLYAVVENGVVTNVVVWDGEGEWSPASGEAIKTDSPVAIGWNYSDGVFTNPNEPQPPTNAELRKQALSALSITYQQDIESLNRAWLAAAVNDGVNETTKKDAVLAQINTRKTQYASDRAAIIAQYP